MSGAKAIMLCNMFRFIEDSQKVATGHRTCYQDNVNSNSIWRVLTQKQFLCLNVIFFFQVTAQFNLVETVNHSGDVDYLCFRMMFKCPAL